MQRNNNKMEFWGALSFKMDYLPFILTYSKVEKKATLPNHEVSTGLLGR
jgi:hypothetical protein